MVNVNRNLAYQSEKSVGGVSENNNNLGSSPKQICVNSGREETLFISSDNIKYQNKSFHQLKRSRFNCLSSEHKRLERESK
jgi:hypothetical protein